MALQEKRVDVLIPRVESLHNQIMQTESILQDKVEETSREVSMVHDYATGLLYSIVEHWRVLEKWMWVDPRAMGASHNS